MANREQRNNREKKKPKSDKKKAGPQASPFAAPQQKGNQGAAPQGKK